MALIIRVESMESQRGRTVLAFSRTCLLVLFAAVALSLTSCGSYSQKDCLFPPSISSISPGAAKAGGPEFTLNVTGDNFYLVSVLEWNGSDRQTTVLSQTQLTAVISDSDIANAGTAEVRVSTPFVPRYPNVDCIGDTKWLRFSINP